MDRFEGKRLNAPNDVVVHEDGHVWFTDPGYGIILNYEGHRAAFELPTNVYRLNPDTGEATVVAGELEKPNGLCFSSDYSRLYLVDTGASHKPDHSRHIRVYDVVEGSSLTNPAGISATWRPGPRTAYVAILTETCGRPRDGAAKGLTEVMSSPRIKATFIGRNHLPEVCANLCFGGTSRRIGCLWLEANRAMYSLYVEIRRALNMLGLESRANS